MAQATKQKIDAELKRMAQELRQLDDNDGYKVLKAQLDRELKRAALWVGNTSAEMAMSAGNDPWLRNSTTFAVALGMEQAKRMGYLECLQRIVSLKEEVIQELEKGRIPWLEKRRR